MPSNTTRGTLARQWELLKLLPAHGAGKTAKELAEALNDAGFKVSKRQVERDLGELSDVFPLDCNNAGMPYGWRWVPGASAELPGLTLAESLSLRLVEDTLRPLLPAAVLKAVEPRLQQAERKLAALGEKHRMAHWAKKVRTVPPALPLQPPAIDPVVLETVQEALLADRQIEVDYQSMDAEVASPVRLHPLGLINRGPVTYLAATAYDYTDVRLYALHRMVKVTDLHQPANQPADFDLATYVDAGAAQFGAGQSFTLEARVSAELARILQETPLAADQTLASTGDHYRVTATVTDSWQLRWWILSQGPAIAVVTPSMIRAEIQALLQEALAGYTQANYPTQLKLAEEIMRDNRDVLEKLAQ